MKSKTTETPPTETPLNQELLQHQQNFYAMVLAVMKNIVATIPAAASAGHLVQQAEVSLNAMRAALSPPEAPPDSEPAGDKS